MTDTLDGYFRLDVVQTPTTEWPRIDTWLFSWNGDTTDGTGTAISNAIGTDGKHSQSYIAGPFVWGENVVFSVGVRYGTKDSAYLAAASVLCTGYAPASVVAVGQRGYKITDVATSSDYEAFGAVLIEYMPGFASLSKSGVPILSVMASGLDSAIHTTYDLQNDTVTGTGAAAVIVAGTDVWLTAGGNKVLYIDTANAIIYGAAFQPLAVADMCPVQELYVQTATSTYWQIFDATCNCWRTWLRLDSDGTINLGYDWKQDS